MHAAKHHWQSARDIVNEAARCWVPCHKVNPENPAAAAEALPGLLAVSARVALVLRAASINPSTLPGIRWDNMAHDMLAAIALATGKGA